MCGTTVAFWNTSMLPLFFFKVNPDESLDFSILEVLAHSRLPSLSLGGESRVGKTLPCPAFPAFSVGTQAGVP